MHNLISMRLMKSIQLCPIIITWNIFKKILTCHLGIQGRTRVALVISFKFSSIPLAMLWKHWLQNRKRITCARQRVFIAQWVPIHNLQSYFIRFSAKFTPSFNPGWGGILHAPDMRLCFRGTQLWSAVYPPFGWQLLPFSHHMWNVHWNVFFQYSIYTCTCTNNNT